MRIRHWILCLMLSATIASVAAAVPLRTNDDIQVRRLGIPDQQPTEQTPDQPLSNDQVDWLALDDVWAATRSQDWARASHQLEELKRNTQGWSPPSNLSILIQSGLLEQALRTAIEEERWSDVLDLRPNAKVSCPTDFQFWAASEALAKTDQMDELQTYLTDALANCRPQTSESTIAKRAIDYLPLPQLRAFDEDAATILSPSDRRLLGDQIKTLELASAAQEQDWKLLSSLARDLGVRDATLQAAWGLLETDPIAARVEFEHALSSALDPEAEYGFALAAYRLGDNGPALALATESPLSNYQIERTELAALAHLTEASRYIEAKNYARAEASIRTANALSSTHRLNASNLTASIHLARADQAYEEEDYAAALAYARKAKSSTAMRMAADSRIAWALYQSGDDEAAYNAFSALYQNAPSEQAADGLVLAASRAGWLDRVQPLAITRPGPLLSRLKSERAGTALSRNHYLIAQQMSPKPLPELVGVDRPYIRQSVSVRSNDGRAGEGRVRAKIARTSAGFSSGQTHIELGTVLVEVSAGRGDDFARSAKETGIAPFVKIDREGETELSAQIAMTPSQGPIDSKLIGEVSIAREISQGVGVQVSVFKQGVDESLTSSFGRENQVTGETWGRVIQTGAEAAVTKTVKQDMTVQTSLSFSQLKGHNTEENQTIKLDIGAVKSFAAEGHAYLSAGPFYQFQAFDQNTNFHSPEHGGYFSPQSYHRIGAGLYGQTEDLKKWMLRYQVSGAVEHTEVDAAPILPRSGPEVAVFQGSSNTALAGAARIEFSRQLSNHWTLSAGATAIASTAFNEAEIGVALKYVPGGKARVSMRDLAPDLFSRDTL